MDSDQESSSSYSSSSSSLHQKMDSDQESSPSSSSSSSSSHPTSSIYNKSSYKEIKVSIILSFVISTFYLYLYIQKEVFIWVDSELKDVYEINNERTWAEQKENIITTLLPPLYKLMNKRYTVSNSDLLRMLHGR